MPPLGQEYFSSLGENSRRTMKGGRWFNNAGTLWNDNQGLHLSESHHTPLLCPPLSHERL